MFVNPEALQSLYKKLVDYSNSYTLPYVTTTDSNGTIIEDLTDPDTKARRQKLDAVTLPEFIKVLYEEEYDKVQLYSNNSLFSAAYNYTSDFYKYIDTLTGAYSVLRTISRIRMHMSDPYSLPEDLIDEYLLSFGFNRYNLIKERDKREILRTIASIYTTKGTKNLLKNILHVMEIPQDEVYLITYWITYDLPNNILKLVGVDDDTKEVHINEPYTSSVIISDPLWQNKYQELLCFLTNSADTSESCTENRNTKINAAKTPYFSILTKQKYNVLIIAWLAIQGSLRREQKQFTQTGDYTRSIPSFGYQSLTGQSSSLSLTEIYYSVRYLEFVLQNKDVEGASAANIQI